MSATPPCLPSHHPLHTCHAKGRHTKGRDTRALRAPRELRAARALRAAFKPRQWLGAFETLCTSCFRVGLQCFVPCNKRLTGAHGGEGAFAPSSTRHRVLTKPGGIFHIFFLELRKSNQKKRECRSIGGAASQKAGITARHVARMTAHTSWDLCRMGCWSMRADICHLPSDTISSMPSM